jgi:hypothetical protein
MTAAFPQDIHWGVQGGLSLSGGIAKEGSVLIKGNPGPGFAFGGLVDIAFSDPRFSIRPGLLFQRETSHADIFDNGTDIRVSYIHLPIDVIYHSDLAHKKLCFGFGPWLAYGLSGSYTQDGQTTPIAFGSNAVTDDAHHLDIGLGFLAGYELNPGMLLTAKFDLGLRDVSSDPQFVTIHTRSFGVNFVYMMPKPLVTGAGKKK